jgi:nucleoside-diphosphate-sugar epimerase
MEKVLITGGAGYIGSILTELLLSKGYEVTIVDNLTYRQTPLLHLCYNENFKIIVRDVTDFDFLSSIISHFDIIIPLAAIVGAPACDINKELATKINFGQIKCIVDNISKKQKLIMPNTNSQYGSSDTIITEDSPFKPLSHYAITKCDAENYILKSGNGICLRLATVFGSSPRMRTDLLVNDFVYRAMTDSYLVLFESHFKRNYIHVKDVSETFLFCIENYDKMNNDVFNVGLSNANLSKLELANTLLNYFQELVVIENEFSKDKDKRNYIVSNNKLESYGWKPKYGIEYGINELIKSYHMIINHNHKTFTNL